MTNRTAVVFLIINLVTFISSQSIESDFILPNTTVPVSYFLLVTTNVPSAAVAFSGVLSLKLMVLEDTNEIFLHSRQDRINEYQLFELNDDIHTEIEDILLSRESENVIKVTSEQELKAGTFYELNFDYQGNLLRTSDGFFRSDYVENVNGADVFTWQAATHFRPFSARHAFPCYDSPKDAHRATFSIGINHNANYSAVSNMAVSEIFDQNTRKDTFFDDTRLLSPSSLAFFISGFSELRKELTSIELFVSARETETNHLAKLIEMTEKILESVESFMAVKLPNKVLHSIALPNFESEVAASYGFVYYREDLVLFNPLVSPSSKEFSIFKLITNAIVSQFLGNIVSFDSWSDAWIFQGLSKLLEYQILSNDDDFDFTELFIAEVLHPILHQQSFIAEYPLTTDDALSEEVAKKAACTFRMIYHAIGSEVLAQALQRLVEENSFSSISAETFFKTVQESFDAVSEHNIDLREVIEGFVQQKTNMIVTVQRNENILRIIKKPISLPINYQTSKMNSSSEMQWLSGSGFEEFVVIPDEDVGDWFILNVDQFGFYRVNYNVDNWMSIIEAIKNNPQVFSVETRAQLIDDAMSFASEEFLSYEIAFELVMDLQNETSFLPWAAASTHLLQLNELLANSELHDEFQQLAVELSENYMKFLGFDDRSQEKTMDKMSRARMIDFTCRMKSEECLGHMHSKLKFHIDSEEEKMPLDSESSAFCFGLMASALSGEGPRMLEALWRQMQESESTELRKRIIESLGCYGDVKVLFDLLETILGSTAEVRYRTAENFQIIQSVFSHTSEGVEATMDFMIEYKNDAVRRSQNPNLIEILIENLSKRIFNERLFDKFKVMLESLNVAPDQSSEALVVIQRNIDWQKTRAADQIHYWLREKRGSTTSSNPSSTPATESTPSTTLAGDKKVFSMILGLFCFIIRLLF